MAALPIAVVGDKAPVWARPTYWFGEIIGETTGGVRPAGIFSQNDSLLLPVLFFRQIPYPGICRWRKVMFHRELGRKNHSLRTSLGPGIGASRGFPQEISPPLQWVD